MIRRLGMLSTKFLLHVAALGPLGRSRFIPATLGSLAGITWYRISFGRATWCNFRWDFLPRYWWGSHFVRRPNIVCGKSESSCIILDECLAMPLCYWGIERCAAQVALWKMLIYGF
jgi:hypothetical protein